jgi:RNA polymerase sigma-70 factor (ECF subfamily)
VDTLTAEELVLRCREAPRGDTRPFELLVERYKQRVFATALRITGNPHDAEDVAQEVFLKVYRNIKNLSEPATLTSWIYTITSNTSFDLMNRTRGRNADIPLTHNEEGDDHEEWYADLHTLSPEEAALQSELRDCLENALQHLDATTRTTLILRDVEGRPYQEIASSLKIGLSAIKMRIHRARESFRIALLEICADAWQRG